MSQPPPVVSIVIPAYHSYSTLAACLSALENQTFKEFETIVVNSSPEHETRAVMQAYPKARFVQHPTRLLPHAARNRGVQEAGGTWLVFTDPDCIPRSDWLERLTGSARAGAVRVTQGGMGLAGNAWIERGIHLCKWSWALPGLPPRRLWLAATGNACYPREIWERVGPFRPDVFCGDALLSWQAARAGYEIAFEPRAVVDQRHNGSLGNLWRERFSRGREAGGVRARFEGWSWLNVALRATLFPGLALLTVARTGRDSFRAGCFRDFLLTIPVQIVGQLAWTLGEARAFAGIALGAGPAVDGGRAGGFPP